MLKLIKMDFYRMRQYKSTWVLASIIAVLAIFVLLLEVYVASGVVEGVLDSSENVTKTVFLLWANMIRGGNMMILLIIFNVIMVSGKYKYGFIKNVAGKVSQRYKFIVSHIVTSAVFIGMLFLVSGLCLTIGSQLFLEHMQFGDALDFFRFFLVEFLLYLSFSSFIICVAEVIRNTGFSMAFLISYVTLFGVLLYSILDYVISEIINLNVTFSLGDYSIVQNISSMELSYHYLTYIRGVIVAVVLLLITSAISTYIISKRDIK